MPTYRITAPDGKTYDVTGPDGSTPEQALEQVKAQYGAKAPGGVTGGMDAATRETLLASKPLDRGGEIQRGFVGSALHQAGNVASGVFRGAGSIGATVLAPADWAMDKLEGNKGVSRNDQRRADMDSALGGLGNDTDSLAYGVGKIGGEVAGTAGVGGVLGKIASAAKLSPAIIAALRSGGIGKQAGNLLTRVGGGAVTGGASAAMVDPTLGNAGVGAAIGGAIPGALSAVKAAGPAIQSGLDSFGRPTAKGRQEAAVRLLQKAGVDKGMAPSLGPATTASGASPVLAERIPLSNPDAAARVAQIQDSLRTANPEFAALMAGREVSNNAARVKTLRDMAGADGGREFAAANRAGTSGPMYQEAFKAMPDAAATSERELRQLMRTPALKEAAEQARRNAANAGQNVGPSNASGSVEGLHQMKMALDDMISKASAKATGSAANEAAGLKEAQKRLVSYIESVSPEYASARGVHRQMSVPLNQMDVAGQLLEKGSAATSDLGGMPRLMPDAFSRQLASDNALVKAATGRDLGPLAKLMEPDQLNKIKTIGSELDRQAAIGRAANGPGSATAKRMMQGQFGMLRNTNEGNAVIRTLGGGIGVATGGAGLVPLVVREVAGHLTRQTQDELGRLLLNPSALSKIMSAPTKTMSPAQQQLRALAEEALRRVPATTATTEEQ